jgi:hypothetical protein
MDEKKPRPAGDTPETAEPPEAEKLSERVPDEASGEPLGALAEHGSRLQQYRKRIEKLASSLRDGAEQHAPPEVLSGLAATAKNVAQYLDGMAARARVKQAKEETPVPEPAEQVPEPEQADSASRN